MIARTLASAAAAVSLAGVAMLGMSSPAMAQTYPPAANPPSISDSTVVPGQTVTVNSGAGSFGPGFQINVEVLGISAIVTADATGNAAFTFTVPLDTPPGPAEAIFAGGLSASAPIPPSGVLGSGVINRVIVPFTVVAAAAANPSQGQRSGLPKTGADQLVPLTIGGVALVGIGAGIVLAARRRQETDMSGGLA